MTKFLRVVFAFGAFWVAGMACGYETWTDPETGIVWTYTLTDGEVSLGGGSRGQPAILDETIERLTIPETINGASVTGVGAYAFENCTKLQAVEIPQTVKSLGRSAFAGCTALTAIEIPASVETLGNAIFMGCISLTSVSTPAYTWYGRIGTDMFSGCTALTSFTIPGNVTSIGARAFSGCTALTTVEFPDYLNLIEVDAFYGCTSLTSVKLPRYTTIERRVFGECRSLTEVTLAEVTATLGEEMFSGCTALRAITLPSTLTTIGEEAFLGCANLASVVFLGDDPPEVGMDAFAGRIATAYAFYPVSEAWETALADSSEGQWNGLAMVPYFVSGDYGSVTAQALVDGSVTFTASGEGTLLGWKVNGENVSETSATLTVSPSSATSVEAVFETKIIDLQVGESPITYTCDALTMTAVLSDGTQYTEAELEVPLSVTDPSTGRTYEVVAIDACAFYQFSTKKGNTAITKVSFAEGSKVTQIGLSAFDGCTNLASFAFPKGVTYIDYGTFSKTGLTSIEIPEGVTGIDGNAFAYCTNLTSVRIPGSVQYVWTEAFYGCENLTSVTLSDGLKEIYLSAFSECPRLTTLSIPESVTVISISAFYNTGLTSITFEGDSQLTTIDQVAFTDCKQLTSFTIPAGVTSIAERAFWGCTTLSKVVFLGEPPEMGENVFQDTAEGIVGVYPISEAWTQELAANTDENGLWNGLKMQGVNVEIPSTLDALTETDRQTLTSRAMRAVEENASGSGLSVESFAIDVVTAGTSEAAEVVQACLDLGLSPAVTFGGSEAEVAVASVQLTAVTAAETTATATYVEPTVEVVAFSPAELTVTFRVVPGTGNTITSEPDTAVLKVYGTDSLSAPMTVVASTAVDATDYLASGEFTVTLPSEGAPTFLKLVVER